MTAQHQSRVGRRSPAGTLAIGVGVALLAIAAAGAYTFNEIRRLRDDQTSISERNRKGSLQLLRIQNDLASLGVLMRDMADAVEPYPLAGWQPAVDRVRRDLAEATALERTLAPTVRDSGQQQRLIDTMDAYAKNFDRMFEVSKTDEPAARRMIRGLLVPQHRTLDDMVSQFLIVNNRVQELAADENRAVYDKVGREILVLIAALLVVTAIAGAWMFASSRRAFAEVEGISAQLRTLSWKTLRVQEDMQRSIARELHDDFGQILTAIGTLLGRARRHAAAAPGSAPLLDELDDVRGVAQQALDRIRSRSRWLHPGILDDFGLVKALEHFAAEFTRQSGIRVGVSSSGPFDSLGEEYAIHVYRIAQEALSNVSRHSGSADAWVRLSSTGGTLELEIEDRGKGMPADAGGPGNRGMGLVSMRERAELMGGELHVRRPDAGGVLILARIPVGEPASPARSELHDATEVA